MRRTATPTAPTDPTSLCGVPAMPFSATRKLCSSSSSARARSSAPLGASVPPLLRRGRLAAGPWLASASSSSSASPSSPALAAAVAAPLTLPPAPASSALAISLMARVLRWAHRLRSDSCRGKAEGSDWGGACGIARSGPQPASSGKALARAPCPSPTCLQIKLRLVHQPLHDFLHAQCGANPQLPLRTHVPPALGQLRCGCVGG